MKNWNRTFSNISLVCSIIVGTLVSVNVFSQTQDQESTSSQPMHEGSWSMQFQIRENLILGAFQGFGVAAKRHYTEHSAVRYCVFLGGSIDDTQADYESSNVNDQNSNDQEVNLTAAYLFYPNPDAHIKIFYGGGPSVGYSHLKQTREYKVYPDLSTVVSTDESRSNKYTFGFKGIIGAEWFAGQALSIHAEYSMGLGYSNEKTVTSSTGSSSTTIKKSNLSLSNDGVTVGLSVYF